MSSVTNLILYFDSLEEDDERIKEVNAFEYSGGILNLVSFDFERGKVSADGFNMRWYGGSKCLEARLFCGAFNWLPLPDFMYHLENKVKWEYRESVQVIVKEDNDDFFRIITLGEKKGGQKNEL